MISGALTKSVEFRIAGRRLWITNQYNMKLITIQRRYSRTEILTWLDKYTTGRFSLSSTQIAFENEADELIFKLGFDNV